MDAAAAASQCLVHEPRCVKALFRRGQAHAALGNAEEAKRDLKRAQQLDPRT